MHLFLKLPPWLSTKLVYIVVIAAYLWKFFMATFSGIFFVALLSYFSFFSLADNKPLTPPELISWLANLPTDYKIAVTSSLITIMGFLIAFHAASVNWRQQMNAQIKIIIAGEIEEFFNEATGLLTDVDIFIKSAIAATTEIQKNGETQKTVFNVQYLLGNLPKFLAARDRLSSLTIKSHRLPSKHIAFLITVWGAEKSLQSAVNAFNETTDKMWVGIPHIDPNDPNLLQDFVDNVNVPDCLSYNAAYEKNFDFINGVSGSIRGQLLSPVAGFNLASLVGFINKRSINKEAITKLHKSNKGRS